MENTRTVELTDEQIAFVRQSLDYSAMRFRDYDYGPGLIEFGAQQRAREQATIDDIREALKSARPSA